MYAKKSVLGLVLILFFLLTLTGASYATQTAPSESMEKTGEDAMMETTMDEATGSGMQKSLYVLPYPGILPDHPLFFLKKLRDSVIEMLIADQVRKSEFYLLQADKHLNAGVFLNEKGNRDLASATIEKSSVFMKRAVDGLTSLKSGGKEIPTSVVDKLEQSTEKHIEVLSEMIRAAEEGARSGLENSLQVVTSSQEELPNLK